MAGSNLSVEAELRYIIQWFNEWSELQRDDFLPVLVEFITKDSQQVYMNGVVSGLAASTCADKPMSLFQCRVKLFREWSSKWSQNMKDQLKEKLTEIDKNFGEKLTTELSPILTNGSSSDTSPSAPPLEPELDQQQQQQPQISPTELVADEIALNA